MMTARTAMMKTSLRFLGIGKYLGWVLEKGFAFGPGVSVPYDIL